MLTAEARFAEVGRVLTDAMVDAVTAWVPRVVAATLETHDTAEREAASLADEAQEAGRRAGAEVRSQMEGLVAADLDEQRTTPLAIARRAARIPTALLARAGVAPVARDRFAVERFPDDHYGLVPASCAELDPALGDLALAWGAAKAAAHRARHGERLPTDGRGAAPRGSRSPQGRTRP